MSDQEIIQQVFEKLKYGYQDYEIDDFLRFKEIDKEQYGAIKEKAYDLFLKHRLSYLPRKNKNRFLVYVATTILVFVIFFLILPRLNIAIGVFPLAVFGALAFTSLLLLSILHYKTWKPEFIIQRDKPEIDWSVFLMLLPIPGIVFYFIISWLFSSASENILMETQEDAIGTVLRGTAYEGRRINHAEITVSFETKAGEKIVTTEDVSTYQFKEFYVGQQINLIYSKTNPRNIDLLVDSDAIKTFKNTQEREIVPNDLFYLLSIDNSKLKDELEKIQFGWQYSESEGFWVNEKNNQAISVKNGILIYISNDFTRFPMLLERGGFKLSEETAASIKNDDEIVSSLLKQAADKVYVKGDLLVSVRRIKSQGQQFDGMSLIEVMKVGGN